MNSHKNLCSSACAKVFQNRIIGWNNMLDYIHHYVNTSFPLSEYPVWISTCLMSFSTFCSLVGAGAASAPGGAVVSAPPVGWDSSTSTDARPGWTICGPQGGLSHWERPQCAQVGGDSTDQRVTLPPPVCLLSIVHPGAVRSPGKETHTRPSRWCHREHQSSFFALLCSTSDGHMLGSCQTGNTPVQLLRPSWLWQCGLFYSNTFISHNVIFEQWNILTCS